MVGERIVFGWGRGDGYAAVVMRTMVGVVLQSQLRREQKGSRIDPGSSEKPVTRPNLAVLQYLHTEARCDAL